MRNRKIRGLLILVVLLVTAYYFLPMVIPNLPSFWTAKRLKLGLDLQGGSQIQLEVDTSKLPEDEKEDAIKTAYEIIRNRIDQFGVSEPLIQRVANQNRIIIQLPGLKDPTRAKNLIGQTAMLEFKLVASPEQMQETYKVLDKFLQENIKNYDYLKEFTDEGETEEVVDVLQTDEDSTDTSYDNGMIFTDLTTSNDGSSLKIDYKNFFYNQEKNEDYFTEEIA